MGVLGDKLASAITEKKKEAEKAKNDINSFIWKGPKKEIAGIRMQSETKLVDATPEQLVDWYKHCVSMLFSGDKVNPGRYVLKEIVNDQINKCTAELFLRWLENTYKKDVSRSIYPRNLVFKDLKASLDIPENKKVLPSSKWKETRISAVMGGIPAEFRDVTIDNVLDGCLDKLGIFDRKHLSLNFLIKLGIEFTQTEMKDLTERDSSGKVRDRFEIVKERLGLRSLTKLHRNPTGLTYTELRSMLNLRSNKYTNLTTDQLVTLKNKVLFRFIQEIDFQIEQWEELIRQLTLVADSKEISLENVESAE